MEVGDVVRTKTVVELSEDPEWKYEPFRHYWEHSSGGCVTNGWLDRNFTIAGITQHSVKVELLGFDTMTLPRALFIKSSTCECSKEKFGFYHHEKWCPSWAPIFKGGV